jgi:hypothetical protein
MDVSKDFLITRPFVLTPDELNKLFAKFEKISQVGIIKAECADGAERKFANLQELVDFEHPPNKDIKTLRFMASGKGMSVWIRFYKKSIRNVYVSAEGPEEVVLPFIEFIEERLPAMRPWYGVIARQDPFSLLIDLPITFVIVFLLTPKLGLLLAPAPSVWPLIAISSIITLLTAFFLAHLRNKFFPAGVFAIGQGAKRHNDKEWVRTLVIIGFAISVVAGIATAAMTG